MKKTEDFHKGDISFNVEYTITEPIDRYEEETNSLFTVKDGYVDIIYVVKQNESDYLAVTEEDIQWLVKQIELKEGLGVSV